MWIKCESGTVTQTTPSVAIDVRHGKALRYHDVIGKSGKIVMVERPEFDAMQFALVLWRGPQPLPIAHGDEHLMNRLRDRLYLAATEKAKGFDVAAELKAVQRAQKRSQKRRKRRGGPNA